MNEKAVKILEQVRKLYQRYGIKSVTMDDVAQNLGISKKTLYEYFSDKEDLVANVLLMEHDDRCCMLSEIESKHMNAIEELFEVYKMIHGFFRDFNPSMEYDIRKYYPELYNRIKEARRKRMYESAMQNLEKGKREGLYRKELDSVIITKMHVFRTESMKDNDMFSMDELSSFKMFHEIFVYHLYEIMSQEGRVFFEANFARFKSRLPE